MTRNNPADVANCEIVTTRVFDAPREMLFRAWLEAEHLSKWWGPLGFTTTFHEFNPKPGGIWKFTMHGPNGTDYPNEMVFLEIEPPHRLVLDHTVPPRFLLLVEFDDFHGKTKMTFRQRFESPEVREKIKSLAGPANEENMDKLAAELATMGAGRHEMLMSRLVCAPRELVWYAWTDPNHLAKWWGPRGFTNPRCEVDLRVGGEIRIDMKSFDGTVYPMEGRFLEIVKPERLVFTAYPIDANGKPVFEATNAVQFTQMGPVTRIDIRATVEKIHDPVALKYLGGREQGWSESLYRLADLLDTMGGRPAH